jgi:N-acetylmuramoyl-L-alanine amidase
MSTSTEEPPDRRAAVGVIGLGLLSALVLEMPAGHAAPSAAGPRPKRKQDTPLPPRVHPRDSWQALPARRPATILDRAPDRIVVHHTETPNTGDLSLAHAYDLSRSVQRFHMRERGWDDTGQQLTISRGGHVMEGRNLSLAAILTGRHVIGAQARRHNEHTIGIENEGNYMSARVPRRLWRSLTEVCVWLCVTYRLDPHRAIVGHRDLVSTDCPGDVLYALLPRLRRQVSARLVGSGRPQRRSPSSTQLLVSTKRG